jgi:hypothetical protein
MGCTASSVKNGTCTPEGIRNESKEIQLLLATANRADPSTRKSLIQQINSYYERIIEPRNEEIHKLLQGELSNANMKRLESLENESRKNDSIFHELTRLQILDLGGKNIGPATLNNELNAIAAAELAEMNAAGAGTGAAGKKHNKARTRKFRKVRR